MELAGGIRTPPGTCSSCENWAKYAEKQEQSDAVFKSAYRIVELNKIHCIKTTYHTYIFFQAETGNNFTKLFGPKWKMKYSKTVYTYFIFYDSRYY